MNTIAVAYTALLLVSIASWVCSVWCYYDCPNDCTHRRYVLPIFVSMGWIWIALQGVLSQAPHVHLPLPDPSSLILGFLGIALALIPLRKRAKQ